MSHSTHQNLSFKLVQMWVKQTKKLTILNCFEVYVNVTLLELLCCQKKGMMEWLLASQTHRRSLFYSLLLSLGIFINLLRGESGQRSPTRCQPSLPAACVVEENAHKWPSETHSNVVVRGKRVLMERSEGVPLQWSQGPGGTSQQPHVQPSSECDRVASANLLLIKKGRGGSDGIAKCWGTKVLACQLC